MRAFGGRLLLLGFLALLAYATIWEVGFLSDDHHLIEDPSIWGFDATGFSRPAAAAAIRLQLALFGPSSPAFHAVSLLLHAVNATLLSLLLRELGLPRPWQLAAGGLHAVAPLHSEAVYWMCCQNYLLEALFLLGGSLAILRRWRLLALGCAAGALLSRESGIVVPIAIAGIGLLAPVADGQPARGGRWLLAFPALIAFHLFLRSLLGGGPMTLGSYELMLGVNLPRNVLHFLGSCLFLTPFDDRPLVALAGRELPLHAGPDGALPAAAILLAAIGLAALVALRGGARARLGLGLFLIAIAPYTPMRSPLGPFPHRFYYVPTIGILVALVASLHEAARTRKGLRAAPLLLAGAGILLGAQTCLRGLDYRRATVVSECVMDALAQMRGEDGRIYVVHGAPDNVDDAYVFRNGLGSAMRRRTGRPDLRFVTARAAPGTVADRQDVFLTPASDGYVADTRP